MAGHETAEGWIVRIDLRFEEFGDHVRLLVRCWCNCRDLAKFFAIPVRDLKVSAERFFFSFERLGKRVKKWVEGLVEGEVVEDREDQESDHQTQWSDSSSNREKSDEANLGEIHTGEELLKGTWINEALGIDLAICNKEDIISVGEIEEPHSYASKEQD